MICRTMSVSGRSSLMLAPLSQRAPLLLARRFSGPGSHQTPIVDALWARRAKAKSDANTTTKPDHVHDRSLVFKSPQSSFQEVVYEFSKANSENLRDQYANPWGRIRVGRLLEDLDALAGTVAHKHCQCEGVSDQHIVTASVDRIKFLHRADLRDDIALSGTVTWVGRSSMQIRMKATSSWATEPFLEANFTFVARDPKTGRASLINPLEVSTDEEKHLFELGERANQRNKEARKLSKKNDVVMGVKLDADGLAAAHALLLEAKPRLSMPALACPQDILLQETKLENTMVAQPQHRNTAGRIFGGFLMRRAYELAFSTAYLFGGRRPAFHELDEVSFVHPVNIGDLLQFESCVLYTSNEIDLQGRHTVHVEVRAMVMCAEKRTTKLSNTFGFTFLGGEGAARRRVLPGTLEQAMTIMERYRLDMAQVQEDIDEAKHSVGSE